VRDSREQLVLFAESRVALGASLITTSFLIAVTIVCFNALIIVDRKS